MKANSRRRAHPAQSSDECDDDEFHEPEKYRRTGDFEKRDSAKDGHSKDVETSLARRPPWFWADFNKWWRNELASGGKRPRKPLVVQWYNDNAATAWQQDMPTLAETLTHAKCLRSTEAVRDYFRRYRAERTARKHAEYGDPAPKKAVEGGRSHGAAFPARPVGTGGGGPSSLKPPSRAKTKEPNPLDPAALIAEHNRRLAQAAAQQAQAQAWWQIPAQGCMEPASAPEPGALTSGSGAEADATSGLVDDSGRDSVAAARRTSTAAGGDYGNASRPFRSSEGGSSTLTQMAGSNGASGAASVHPWTGGGMHPPPWAMDPRAGLLLPSAVQSPSFQQTSCMDCPGFIQHARLASPYQPSSQPLAESSQAQLPVGSMLAVGPPGANAPRHTGSSLASSGLIVAAVATPSPVVTTTTNEGDNDAPVLNGGRIHNGDDDRDGAGGGGGLGCEDDDDQDTVLADMLLGDVGAGIAGTGHPADLLLLDCGARIADARPERHHNGLPQPEGRRAARVEPAGLIGAEKAVLLQASMLGPLQEAARKAAQRTHEHLASPRHKDQQQGQQPQKLEGQHDREPARRAAQGGASWAESLYLERKHKHDREAERPRPDAAAPLPPGFLLLRTQIEAVPPVAPGPNARLVPPAGAAVASAPAPGSDSSNRFTASRPLASPVKVKPPAQSESDHESGGPGSQQPQEQEQQVVQQEQVQQHKPQTRMPTETRQTLQEGREADKAAPHCAMRFMPVGPAGGMMLIPTPTMPPAAPTGPKMLPPGSYPDGVQLQRPDGRRYLYDISTGQYYDCGYGYGGPYDNDDDDDDSGVPEVFWD